MNYKEENKILTAQYIGRLAACLAEFQSESNKLLTFSRFENMFRESARKAIRTLLNELEPMKDQPFYSQFVSPNIDDILHLDLIFTDDITTGFHDSYLKGWMRQNEFIAGFKTALEYAKNKN